MSSAYQEICKRLEGGERYSWLITGVAGFIGSNLLSTLLDLDQNVIGLDNLSTGYAHNLDEARDAASPQQWKRFRFIEGDVRDRDHCALAVAGVDFVLHQAALGSVPRSLEDPQGTNAHNIDGFLNMITAARDEGVRRFVYASSSSVYGDHETLPKTEGIIGRPLSPYAVTKRVNELYADVFHRSYGLDCIGLRYFNVFGPRQDPEGAYAAVIPRWFDALIGGETALIYGDGETSRDFCYIDNAVQVNILAAVTEHEPALNQVYNVACGSATTLNELYAMIRDVVATEDPSAVESEPRYEGFRPGDIRHSLADVSRARELLGYSPSHGVSEGLAQAAKWYITR